MSLINVACGPHRMPRVIGRSKRAQLRAVSRMTGWAHFGHTQCPQRSILVNHISCRFAAQCRFGSETSTPKRVRFPAAPQRNKQAREHFLPPRPPEDDSTRSIGVPNHHGALPVARNSSIFETNLNFRSMSFVTYARISVMRPSLTSKQSQS
jgi:hypothetical protein